VLDNLPWLEMAIKEQVCNALLAFLGQEAFNPNPSGSEPTVVSIAVEFVVG
jgi:hypothetical protein